jgi:hypothetical protein
MLLTNLPACSSGKQPISQEPQKKQDNEIELVIKLDNGINITKKRFSPDSAILIDYPVISGMENLNIQGKINKKLEEIFIAKHREGSEKDATTGEFFITFETYFDVAQIKNLLIITRWEYFYEIGAVHGQTFKNVSHIDLLTGQFYELKNLFKNNCRFTEKLISIVHNKFTLSKGSEEWNVYLVEKIDSLPSNQEFIITKNALIIYYQKYEIACFAAGFPSFTIDFNDIDHLFDKNAPFYKSFN